MAPGVDHALRRVACRQAPANREISGSVLAGRAGTVRHASVMCARISHGGQCPPYYSPRTEPALILKFGCSVPISRSGHDGDTPVSIFSIGLSGLNAARVGYDTVSNNVSNVYTPGYNREVMVLTGKAAGGGVSVAGVPRRFDAFVARQLNGVNSKTSALAAYKTQVEQIDNLLADEDAGLAPLMQDFFASVSALASAPADPAARQGVIGNADILSAQFRSFDQYLSDMGQSLGGQLQSEVTQINNPTPQIAKLNDRINTARARSREAPNRLLNQRDHLVAELAKHMDVRSHVQDDGSYFVATSKGRPVDRKSTRLNSSHVAI